MKRKTLFVVLLAAVILAPRPAGATATQSRIIVRSSLGSSVLSSLCLLQGCTVVQSLDGTLNQVFLLTAPLNIDVNVLLNVLRATPGILEAELDQVIPLVGGLNQLTSVPSGCLTTRLSPTSPLLFGMGTRISPPLRSFTSARLMQTSASQASESSRT
jgi:hypothetical protein